MVLAEDIRTGTVEPQRVEAVIVDGFKPLLTLNLSDGSHLSATANHPFYVDAGPGIASPEWLAAGDLQTGDQLRTEDGRDVTVTTLQYHSGYAPVYTLTVATDHDFFVGGARVLVHNSLPCKPTATNSRLANLIEYAWRSKTKFEVIGNGSTADLIRDQRVNGVREGMTPHIDKGWQVINAFNKWIRENPQADPSDIDAARLMRDDLRDALKGLTPPSDIPVGPDV